MDEPEFGKRPITVAEVAKIYGKDPAWVRTGIVVGWLPIGRATRHGQLITSLEDMDSRKGRINFYISPRKLWLDTGYVWKVEYE